MFLISRNGTRALDVEVASHGDTTIKVQDLEDAKRDIIALSGIAPGYVGYGEVFELREQLVQVSIAFAQEIAEVQQSVNQALKKLVDIIAEVEGKQYKPSDYYKISLVPPTSLMLQLIESTIASVGNVFGTLQSSNIAFDPYHFLEEYAPYLDWEEFREKSEAYQRKLQAKGSIESLELTPPADDGMGGGPAGGFR